MKGNDKELDSYEAKRRSEARRGKDVDMESKDQQRRRRKRKGCRWTEGMRPLEHPRKTIKKVWDFQGSLIDRMTYYMGPSKQRIAEMLEQLLESGKIGSHQELASSLGVHSITLKNWMLRKTVPEGAAKKLIWIYWSAAFEPENLETFGKILTWGRMKL